MFAVVEYTNYRKSVSIVVHGHSTCQNKAKEYALTTAAANHPGYTIIPRNINRESYVWMKAGPKGQSKVLHEFEALKWAGSTDEECEQLFDELAEYDQCPEWEVKSRSEVTVHHVLKYYDIDAAGEAKIAEKVDLTAVVGDNLALCKEVLNFLVENQLGDASGYFEERKDICVSTQIYAVVHTEEI
jgi:hypothetical protein